MTAAEIRQSFFDFFREKQHTIVPSASLLPDSPNLLFTNAGMNQFVPIFLGQQKPAWDPPRTADTQKCIRAGGKHNDLDDVGLDTYHHTFFEMLGNWSFGDYFKKEAIEWAWELVVERWKFPAKRVYATVYCPFMGEEGWERKWQGEISYAVEVVRKGAKVYGPDRAPDKVDEGIASADQLSAQYWAERFLSVNLDPQRHVVPGGAKDNFWMMGDTGPCGPCSELHIDLTPDGDTEGSLVNAGDPRCIEIWNLVFIQFNANADGTFSPLPQSHVDTGMGFERVTAMIQGTKHFSDFSCQISNYETDIFRPIFDKIEKLSEKKYSSSTPGASGTARALANQSDRSQEWSGLTGTSTEENIDIAFRVIADHIRTLSFAVADGIQPSNEGRGYVLRRILRRAVRYGRTLGFHEPFFFKLVDVVAHTMGAVFPELRAKQSVIKETLRREEEAFNKTLDKGIEIFEGAVDALGAIRKFIEFIPPAHAALETFILKEGQSVAVSKAQQDRLWDLVFAVTKMPADFDTDQFVWNSENVASSKRLHTYRSTIANWQTWWNTKTSGLYDVCNDWANDGYTDDFFIQNVNRMQDGLARVQVEQERERKCINVFPAELAFRLYDEQGFPLDLTQLMARERELTVDITGFESLMEQQRTRARAAQKREVITLETIRQDLETEFVGYEQLSCTGTVRALEDQPGNKHLVIPSRSPFYAAMGGQVADTGWIEYEDDRYQVVEVHKTHAGQALQIDKHLGGGSGISPFGRDIRLTVDSPRRAAIQRHHSVTHLLHWALHEKVSKDAVQKGSYVGPEKLTFDFSSAALTAEQKRQVEDLVNEKVKENATVSWTEIPYSEAKKRSDIQQFFGDKYGETVRVVQIGGESGKLNGYSMELCGGTHVRATRDIGAFRIVKEEAIAAGIRRIEAVAGEAAKDWAKEEAARQEQKFQALARKKSDIAALPAFAETGDTEAVLRQIDARSVHLGKLEGEVHDWQKQQAKASEADLKSRAAATAKELRAAHGEAKAIVDTIADADGKILQGVVDVLKSHFSGPIFLAGSMDGRVALIASVPKELTGQFQANKLIQEIAPIVGGKGGGRPDNAQGAGNDAAKIDEALSRAREILL